MTLDDGFTATLETHLETVEGPPAIPAALRAAVHASVRTTGQRRPPRWVGGRSRRGRPLGLLAPVGALAAVAIAIVGLRLLPGGGGPVASRTLEPSPTSPPAVIADLGVFEPARGRIVFRVGSHLEAVDPDHPGSAVTIEPGDLGLGTSAMPAGWSADGTRLAISDEFHGADYVMDDTGTLTRVSTEQIDGYMGGCCWFVESPWLSPDGMRGLKAFPVFSSPEEAEGWQLVAFEVADPTRSQTFDLGPAYPEGIALAAMPAWSPDASKVAYLWNRGRHERSGVAILDLLTGRIRDLWPVWSYVRHLAWSPDGSRLLAVAGFDSVTGQSASNPLLKSRASTLYALDVDDGDAHPIADGYFIAGAWSPDGTRIAAIDFAPGGRRSVVVLDTSGSAAPTVLAELSGGGSRDTYLFSGITWHPVP
jgi:hypothetical protein